MRFATFDNPLAQGRAESIQNGHARVPADEVDQVLLLHPDVAEARTFALPDLTFGEAVGVAVVLRAGATANAAALKKFSCWHLPPQKIPRRILLVNRIPQLPRSEMAKALGVAAAPASAVFPIQADGCGVPLFIVAPPDDARFDLECAVFGVSEPDLSQLVPPHTIEHIAAECVRAVRRFQPEGPYALGGCESKWPIAMEMARQMEQEGEEIAFLALLDGPGSKSFLRTVLSRVRALVCRRMNLPRHDRPRCWSGTTIRLPFAG